MQNIFCIKFLTKDIIKTITYSLFLFLAIIFFSCKKENNNSVSIPYITNPTSYVLTSEIWSGPATNGEYFYFTYNSEHLISKIQRIQWGTESVNGGSMQKWYDTANYAYEYTHGLCSRWIVTEGGSNWFYTYEYNNNKLPVKRTVYSMGDYLPERYYLYKYDNSNNLVEIVDSSLNVNFRYEFTYNSNNNLTSVTSYQGAIPVQKEQYQWLAFDNKINFIKAVNGLPPTFVWDNNFNSYSSSSPNNILTENYYSPADINQPFGPAYPDSYSYQYNDEGLPTTMQDGPWIVNFEYEKYK
jgi:YD repeat-containing protein